MAYNKIRETTGVGVYGNEPNIRVRDLSLSLATPVHPRMLRDAGRC